MKILWIFRGTDCIVQGVHTEEKVNRAPKGQKKHVIFLHMETNFFGEKFLCILFYYYYHFFTYRGKEPKN